MQCEIGFHLIIGLSDDYAVPSQSTALGMTLFYSTDTRFNTIFVFEFLYFRRILYIICQTF